MGKQPCSRFQKSSGGGWLWQHLNFHQERYTFYPHQVGGHFCLVKPAKETWIHVQSPHLPEGRPVEGCKVVLKPFEEAEFHFYQNLGKNGTAPLIPFTPHFYGTKTLLRKHAWNLSLQGIDSVMSSEAKASYWKSKWSSHECRKFIVLEDIGNVLKPCLIDLKMGCKQRSARYNSEKRSHMATKASESSSGALGFRICGMQCWDPESHTLQFYDKYWGQKVRKESMIEALGLFFPENLGDADSTLWKDVVKEFLKHLAGVRDVVTQLPGKRFWSSSLLLSFDVGYAEENDREKMLKSVRLRMIDFTHFTDVGEDDVDEEYLCGLDNLHTYLQALLVGRRNESICLDLSPGLCSVPPSSRQDAEEIRARQVRLEVSRKPKPEQEAEDYVENHTHFHMNAQTISPATGEALRREIGLQNFCFSHRRSHTT